VFGGFGLCLLVEVLALTLGYKLIRWAEYSEAVSSYTILRRAPAAWRKLAAASNAGVEALCIGLLIVPVTRQAGGVLAAGMFALFATILWLDRRPSFSKCGCWGASDIEAPASAFVARDICLLALAIVVAVLNPTLIQAAVVTAAWALMAFPFALLLLEGPHLLHVGMFGGKRPSGGIEIGG
jgi:Methylamine utilisation protein MauE